MEFPHGIEWLVRTPSSAFIANLGNMFAVLDISSRPIMRYCGQLLPTDQTSPMTTTYQIPDGDCFVVQYILRNPCEFPLICSMVAKAPQLKHDLEQSKCITSVVPTSLLLDKPLHRSVCAVVLKTLLHGKLYDPCLLILSREINSLYGSANADCVQEINKLLYSPRSALLLLKWSSNPMTKIPCLMKRSDLQKY